MFSRAAGWATAAIALVMVMSSYAEAVPYGTVLNNQATLSFTIPADGPGISTITDSASFTVDRISSMEVLQYSASAPQTYIINAGQYDTDGTGTVFNPNPSVPPTYPPSATPVNISVPVPLEPLATLNIEDPIFLVINDVAENTNPALVEYLDVTVTAGAAGEVEIIRLAETGPDTGIFSAYIQTVDAASTPVDDYDGLLSLTSGDAVDISYTDSDSNTSSFSITADPLYGSLNITKVSIGNKVAQGGYIQYQVTVDETAGYAVPGVTVIDTLPPGFIFQPGSAMINSASSPAYVPLADPVIGGANDLTFTIGDMTGNESVNIVYDVQVAPGTTLGNTTDSVYATGASGAVVSNTASALVSVELPALMEILRVSSNPAAPTYDINAGMYSTDGTVLPGSFAPNPSPAPTYAATGAVAIGPLQLEPLTIMHMNDPVFLAVTDDVRNADPLTVEYVTVSISAGAAGETEIIRLVETGPDTGIFTAYVQTFDAATLPVAANDGYLSLSSGDTISLNYTDDDGLASFSSLLSDPSSIVFDARTGALLDGLTVTILNSLGLPAIVYGDDGTSLFPASIQTGSSFVSGGKTYTFPPGGYRFPYIPAGQHSLLVTSTPAFTFPSVVSDAQLQALPGAPYVLTPASRGTAFTVADDHAIQVDLPVDSYAGGLFITKVASRDSAAIGDHLQYRVTVDESSGNTVFGAAVTDKLPLGIVYVKGSAMINGSSALDPVISSDRRTLIFGLGDMAPAASAEIKYVVAVTSGTRTGNAVNSAYASGQFGEMSNLAEAVVRIYEDLFKSKAIIMGRVVADACGLYPDARGEGVEGVRIYMDDGTYVVTDDKGMFHFKGVKPGGHVVQLDYDTLPALYEPVLCADTTESSGSSFSRFVDIQGGALWRTDFHLSLKPRERGEIKAKFLSTVSQGEIVEYSIPVKVETIAVDNIRITIVLPKDVRYSAGSSSFRGVPVADPVEMDSTLIYRLGSIQASSSEELKFTARTTLDGRKGRFISRMLLVFDTLAEKNISMPVLDNILIRSFEENINSKTFTLSTEFEPLRSELTSGEIKELDQLIAEIRPYGVHHIIAIGYTDSLPLRKEARKLYPSNYELSKERAKTVAYYLGEKLGLSAKSVSYLGHGSDNPIGDNSTEEGRKKNRRVEINAITMMKVKKNRQLTTESGSTSSASLKTEGHSGERSVSNSHSIGDIPEEQMPAFDEPWMSEAGEGLEMVWPIEGEHPSLPALMTAILHSPDSELLLTLNDVRVNPVYMQGRKTDKAGKKAVTVYKGIPLADGDNDLIIRQVTNGIETGVIKRNIHYSTRPVKAELVPDWSDLLADGRTSPVIAVHLTDRDGYPVRKGIKGEFSVAGPHRALEPDSATTDSLLEGRQRFTVGSGGIAYIKLAPTTNTGEARLKIHGADGDLDVMAWLSPEIRDWILVGFAEGTLGHSTLKGNAEALLENSYEDGSYTDGKVSFFAKGRVKGKWLLTMAYDSDKPSYNEYELHSIIDPDEYYTLYGDSTEQGHEAASARRLYLKIESDRFYALFGDYDTGLTVTKLSRYSRSLNGFKADYNGEHLRYRVFASDTSQAFVKDEIRGDGTSGLYRLSRKNIVLNSDKVYIEVRDRFRQDVVLETRNLTRHIDYDIDYIEGTLFFRQPVNSADQNFNPAVIVADYESYDDSDTSLNYGGRGAVSLADNKVEVGASFIHEESVGREGDLAGYDATLRLGDNTEVKAEFATTTVDTPVDSTEGSAYLLEVSRKHGKLNARAYFNDSDADFGLGQQPVAEKGLRRLGFDFSYKASGSMNIQGRAFRQDNLVDNAQREHGEASMSYRRGNFMYTGGLRSVTDTFSDGTSLASEQVTAGIVWHTLNNRLTFKLLREQSISDSDDNADYPTRTTLGAEYRLSGSTTLFAAQEYSRSDEIESEATRAGIATVPWNGASLKTSIERQFNENGSRVFSNFGLTQSWKVSETWGLSASLDGRDTIMLSQVPSVSNAASALGEDFTAVSLGSTYSRKGFSWRNRIEHREADSYDKSGLFMAVNGEPRDGLGLSAALRAFSTDRTSGEIRRDLSLRLGMVRRPVVSRWTLLDRFDYISTEEKGGQLEYDTWRVVNNLNLNYKLDEDYQISIQYGSKYVKDSIDGTDYKGYTDLKGLEFRYNLNNKWDLGTRFSMLQSWEYDRHEYQSGLSVGYTYTKNVWLSMGYNFDGFRDRDFSAADYTAAGPFFRFKVKFDQLTAKDAVRYFTGN